MEFKKLSAVEMVDTVDQDATVLIEKDGIIKRAPKNEIGAQANWAETDSSSPAFIKNKPSKELVYEWNFSADDEVYEIYENVDEDLSWLTKRQDNISFEIICEHYAYQYDWNNESQQHNYIYFENVFATSSSADSPHYTRYTNVPILYSDNQIYVCKEKLHGEIYGLEHSYEYLIDDVTERSFRLEPYLLFDVNNGTHYDLDNDWAPINIENGGCIMLEAGDSPFKSVKIYKITH